ncbi:MFS transporter [Streptomyces sp. G2]|uniref:MFS transporter n=1 Tax=Streptomyces sp. G2 TaxID=1684471 RepID=UPI00202E105C|nr:MFS transporter [Streptomyces sp. G2]MCM1945265.1 MFS transporter [Streptomyces sp. G2]
MRISAALLPESRSGRTVALAAAVDAMAVGLFLAAATLYFVGTVGISAVAVGGALTAANVLGLLAPAPFGSLAGRLGALPVYVGLTLVRAAGFLAYAAVDGLAGYLTVTCAVTVATRAAIPLLQVVVGELEPPERRTRTMAALRAVANIGMTAGFLLAAVVQATRERSAFTALFVANAAAFTAVALLVLRARRLAAPAAGKPPPVPEETPAAAHGSPYRDRRFLAAAAANAVLLLNDSVLFVLVPLWTARQEGLPSGTASVVLAVNTVLTVVLQVYVARLASHAAGALRLLWPAWLALVAACLLFAAADGRGLAVALGAVVLAVTALTVGENLHAVSAWELSYVMAPPRARPQYLSVFSMGMSAQLIAGPVLMTAFVLPSGPLGWLVLAGLFTAATAVFAAAARPAATGARAELPTSTAPTPERALV